MVKSDAAESYVRSLAEVVDGKFKEVGRGKVPTYHHAVLAAMSLADELVRERGQRAALRKKVQERGRAILELLERERAGD